MVAALVLVAVVWTNGGSQSNDAVLEDPPAHHIGEWVELDNRVAVARLQSIDEDERDIDTTPLGEWEGVLRVRVDQVTEYDSPHAAGISDEDVLISGYLEDWKRDDCGLSLLMIDFTVDASSAQLCDGADIDADGVFGMDLIATVEGSGLGDILYYDAREEQGAGGDEAHTETTLRVCKVGHVVDQGSSPSFIWLGNRYGGERVEIS